MSIKLTSPTNLRYAGTMQGFKYWLKLLVALLALLMVGCHRTVPEEVLHDWQAPQVQHDGPAMGADKVFKLAVAEAKVFEANAPLPDYGIMVLDRWGTNANVVFFSKPVDTVVPLWSYYLTEDQAHFEMAHELGHIYLKAHGITQSEAGADAAAMCFGSEQAQAYAAQLGRDQGSCEVLGK